MELGCHSTFKEVYLRSIHGTYCAKYDILILLHALVACFSWIVQFSDFENHVLFSSTTNSGALLVFITPFWIKTSTKLYPIISGMFIVVTFCTASSFAFHLSPEINSPAHIMDIVTAWILYIYLACVCLFSLSLLYFDNRIMTIFTYILNFVANIVIIYNYNEIWLHYQNVLFISCGFIIYLSLLFIKTRRIKFVYALFDILPLLFIQASSTILQGELWIKSVSRSVYNITHGYWHLGNMYVVGVLIIFLIEEAEQRETFTWCKPITYVTRFTFWMFHLFLVGVSFIHDTTIVYSLVCSVQFLMLFLLSIPLFSAKFFAPTMKNGVKDDTQPSAVTVSVVALERKIKMQMSHS
jgi:hypothetical protein